MADNNELQTARIKNTSPGSYIDNNLAELELALRTILGISADVDYSPAMAISSAGNVVLPGTLILAADPATDNEVATKQYVDGNTSSAASVYAQVKRTTAEQAVGNGVTAAVSWEAAELEFGGTCWAVGNPTRLVTPDDGEYFVEANIHCDVDELWFEETQFYVSVKKNGTLIHDGLWGIMRFDATHASTPYGASVTFTSLESCAVGDYFEFFVTAVNGIHNILATYTRASIMKVG